MKSTFWTRHAGVQAREGDAWRGEGSDLLPYFAIFVGEEDEELLEEEWDVFEQVDLGNALKCAHPACITPPPHPQTRSHSPSRPRQNAGLSARGERGPEVSTSVRHARVRAERALQGNAPALCHNAGCRDASAIACGCAFVFALRAGFVRVFPRVHHATASL